MPTQQQLDEAYLGTALLHSKLSKARRKAVGAVLITKTGVAIPGYNGTPVGLSNECEHRTMSQAWGGMGQMVLTTKPEVIHAELNCILKAAKEGVSVEDATIYTTLSPCVPCAAMLINAGIKELVWQETYRDTSGIDLLKQAGIITRQVQLQEST